MTLPTPDIIRAKMESRGLDVRFLHVTQDRQVVVSRCAHPAYASELEPIPLLMLHLCMEGGGPLRLTSNQQVIDDVVLPGSIGVIPPHSNATGTWPAMEVISFGISVTAVAESFGETWPEKLTSDMVSKTFRDPLVEATMLDMGHTRAGSVSDAGLIHAAHMITHRLLDRPEEGCPLGNATTPLGKATLMRIDHLIANTLERHVSVAEMAALAGMSRHHFSRRFKAATGQSPLQYAIRKKLEHAAVLLESDDHHSVLSVAQMVGFNNPAHFARTFRRQFGVAPRLWKSEQRHLQP